MAFYKRTGVAEITESTSPRAFASVVTQDVDVFSKLIRDAKLDVD